MAEGERFELSEGRKTPQRFSRPPLSAAQASLRIRARTKITSPFGISSSGHFLQILKTKNLEIVHYYCVFCSLKSAKPNQNLSAKNVKFFLREPFYPRRSLKKSCINVLHSFSIIPGVISILWFSRSSAAILYRDPAAPAFGSAEPNTT